MKNGGEGALAGDRVHASADVLVDSLGRSDGFQPLIQENPESWQARGHQTAQREP